MMITKYQVEVDLNMRPPPPPPQPIFHVQNKQSARHTNLSRGNVSQLSGADTKKVCE